MRRVRRSIVATAPGSIAVREATCAHCGTAFETLNQARKFCSDRCRMAAFARRKRAALRSKLGTAP